MHNKALVLAIRTADHLVERGEPEAAANILQRYLAAYPPSAQVLQRLGRLRLAQGKSAEAAALLQQALACREGPEVDAPGGSVDDEVNAAAR